jgi:hypothetical protein
MLNSRKNFKADITQKKLSNVLTIFRLPAVFTNQLFFLPANSNDLPFFQQSSK